MTQSESAWVSMSGLLEKVASMVELRLPSSVTSELLTSVNFLVLEQEFTMNRKLASEWESHGFPSFLILFAVLFYIVFCGRIPIQNRQKWTSGEGSCETAGREMRKESLRVSHSRKPEVVGIW